MAGYSKFVAELIEAVKDYKVLYDRSDTHHKDNRTKNKIWDTISKNMGCNTSGEKLKHKWKNLKDCYTKYRRAYQSNTNVPLSKSLTNYKSWPWAEQMKFFEPYLFLTPPITSVFINDAEVDEGSDNSDVDTVLFSPENDYDKQELDWKNLVFEETYKHERIHTVADNAESSRTHTYDNNKPSFQDEIELTFVGYAASVRKLSSKRQALIKFKIAKLIMEEELAQLNEQTSR